MQTSYQKYDSLSKEPVLFLHGNLASHRWWGPMAGQWRLLGPLGPEPLVCSDWRGCGDNPPWPADKPSSLAEIAQDQIELLDALGIRRAAVVGHSLGGLIALELLSRAPERFTRAVFLDSVGPRGIVFDDSMYAAFRQMAASAELTRAVILGTVAGQERLPGEFADQLARDAYKAVQGIGGQALRMVRDIDMTGVAARVKTPSLILHGALDTVIPVSDAELLASCLPEATLEILPSAGHCWNIEDPRAFASRVRQWLDC